MQIDTSTEALWFSPTRRGLARAVRGILLLFVITVALAAPAFGSHQECDVRATGRWLCRTHANINVPLPFVKVELWNSNCRGSHICDSEMGTAFTDANGRFDFTGRGGDLGSFPDPYVKVLLQNLGPPAVTLRDEIDRIRLDASYPHDHDDTCGTIDFGDLAYNGDAQNETTHCEVFLATRRAAERYFNAMGGQNPPYGELKVLHWSAVWASNGAAPYADYTTIRWPIGHGVWPATHEFGHTFRHFFDGSHVPHFSNDLGTYALARKHNLCDSNHLATHEEWRRLGFAFNEGWAEYWNGDTNGCGPNYDDMTLEGNVARGLRRIEATCGLSKRQMVEVLQAYPEQIHSFGEYYDRARLRHPGCDISFGSVASKPSALVAVVDPARQFALAAAASVRLIAAAATLKAESKAANGELKILAPCTPGAGCESNITAVLNAHALKYAFKQAKAEVSLNKKLGKPASFAQYQASVESEKFSTRLTKTTQKHNAKLGRLLIKTYDRAAASITPMVGDHLEVLGDLTAKKQAVQHALDSGTGLPSYASQLPGLSAVAPGSPSNLVFITKNSFSASQILGLLGADDICVTEASQAGVIGNFRAWMSDSNTSASVRHTHGTDPYVMADGTKVADDWDDLTDGSLDAAITIDAFGEDGGLGGVWTATDPFGGISFPGNTCSNWTSDSGYGADGYAGAANGDWSLNSVQPLDFCSVASRLYCFQQQGTTPCDGVTCTPSDQCHVAGTCNPNTGICSNPPAPDGTTCNDGNPATYIDACSNGTCVGTTCPCDGRVFPGPTGDPTWGPSFNTQSCNAPGTDQGELVSQPTTCSGLSSQYLGRLFVSFVFIDPPGFFECGARTTYLSGPNDCSFTPASTTITETQAHACLASLKAIAAADGVGCPF